MHYSQVATNIRKSMHSQREVDFHHEDHRGHEGGPNAKYNHNACFVCIPSCSSCPSWFKLLDSAFFASGTQRTTKGQKDRRAKQITGAKSITRF